MAGHSKWANIKHRKGAQDAKRGKVFTKIIKEITVAARLSGGDLEANPRLRRAVSNARSNNMPQDNIFRAIKKGTGELEGVNYEEMIYEAYGPIGIAIYMEVITDNKNRTVSELRHILNKNNGSLAEPGSVSWMFRRVGMIILVSNLPDENTLLNDILESGANDFEINDNEAYVSTEQSELMVVKENLEIRGYNIKSSELIMSPNSLQSVDIENADKVLNLMEIIDNHDDVNQVYSNFSLNEVN
ncbi:YebC/PmpR family DNA-binding transcriptional regulator [bacterium]|jgi:YebC/PmpR family DNA-binding regulatory protein|nr:YebC/PmpR family DNA-binding transcriptional regulator [bacterium]MBT4249899.1 YebC/PmpR family DNA-binding transcriptional regulator [bacterium]MBT5734436.1 YebC/PmpR family DNA-binding transcriptional regulator [bacterium]MBT6018791.1 YebC/PmpR family DNA-binding transcriptional regulator [bacterium]MDA9594249.1 YebC/PmpR family DNA-binding transcriptional regulator [bacterium]